MDENEFAFDLVRRVVRAVPDRLPGKTRLARAALRPFHTESMARIPDKFGNMMHSPSLEEPISLGLFAFGVYEPDTLSAVLRHLHPVGVFLDVGANIGALALPVAARKPAARVICIEADPEMVSLLQRNVTENMRSNITIVHCAAGAIDAPEVPFYRAPRAKFGMGSLGPQFGAMPITLTQCRLDALLDKMEIDYVDVVKLDIEGAELGALLGLTRRLTGSHPPALVFEFADWAETRIDGQVAGSAQLFLLSLGYRLFRLARGGKLGARFEQPITTGSTMIFALPSSHMVAAKDEPGQVVGNLTRTNWGQLTRVHHFAGRIFRRSENRQ